LASTTPTQQRVRERIEALIRLAAPALDLLLVAGDRVSRAVDRGDATELSPPPVRSQRAIAGQVRRD
jgi:hypothetical protein